jgi:hypothetical protein
MRSDLEGKVHEVTCFVKWCKLPFEFTESNSLKIGGQGSFGNQCLDPGDESKHLARHQYRGSKRAVIGKWAAYNMEHM